MDFILLPICITSESFPYYTISKLRKPITMNFDDLWDEHIDQWQWTVVDDETVKAFGFSYDGWRIIDETV